MSRRSSLALRGLLPVAVAFGAVALTTTSAWADPPRPPHGPIQINDDQCTRDHGRIVIDRNDHRTRRCEGGPHNGREVIVKR
ncbi:hypothetical protein [Pseudonocardia acaciae]|uniref:hypothetical protein n=1 Tax=Pseudonocardia acaciae TaxID=551276 RepID=UPI00048BB946|nr:hypothetical protein [Pseudonocardia acaciae]